MNVLLGVSGGIACYKSVELLRELTQRGATVQVVMTRAAQGFVTPRTFAALSARPVLTSLWDTHPTQDESNIEHIAVARWADVFVIAPATANVLAQLAHGLATDFLTTVALAIRARLVLAPAMNSQMFDHPATQANLQTLVGRGAHIVSPESGFLACGLEGNGRLAPIEQIADAVLAPPSGAPAPASGTRETDSPQDLTGQTILITAGGTREPIDPVRFLGNRSSGKMGFALAEAAQSRGARVTLITTVTRPASPGIDILPVTTADEMRTAVLAHLPRTTALYMAAAVADFRIATPATSKLHRTEARTLELIPTEDIVAEAVRQRRSGTTVVAFAAETENLVDNARAKLHRKGVDAIVANDVSDPAIGFESDANAGLLLTREATIELPPQPKLRFAHAILDATAKLR